MTKPAVPPSAPTGEVVEIDAMDGMEWETPAAGERWPGSLEPIPDRRVAGVAGAGALPGGGLFCPR